MSLFDEMKTQIAEIYLASARPILYTSVVFVLVYTLLILLAMLISPAYTEWRTRFAAQISQQEYLVAACTVWIVIVLVITSVLLVILWAILIFPLLLHVLLYLKIAFYLTFSTEMTDFLACGVPLTRTYVYFYLIFSLCSPYTLIYMLMLCTGKRLQGRADAEALAFLIFLIGYLTCLAMGARIFHNDQCPAIRETQAFQMASAKFFLSLYEFFILLVAWFSLVCHKFVSRRREATYVEVNFQGQATAAITTTPPLTRQSYDSFGSSPAVFSPISAR